ncbi:MAG: AAA family ATPase [Calditrichaeota bacterium]|nr:MAG: AAA family ATPase [Calditrichota bacterium]MBL1207144.1 AAA family ATPase [Calditrichota bacterium]NOG46974.1 sigma 54-interacting transcriptional regulator [Calditrichota bacterium]
MIYFTFAGNHDDLKPDDTLGALFNIYASFKDSITDVYILVSPTNLKTKVSYKKIADKNRSRILSINPKVNVNLIPIELTNPVEFNVVYPRLLVTIQDIIQKAKIEGEKKIINITSGTPTMSTCWVLLQQSGIIKNAELIQSFEPAYAREKGKSYQVVEFPTDDFPKVTAPDSIKAELTALKRESDHLKERVTNFDLKESIPLLIGSSPPIKEVKEQITQDIDQTTHVLITGERGTGKEVVAQSIWQRYKKEQDKELTTRDCSVFAEGLIASEIFGHKKGAFTGAVENKVGIIESCNGKMLFLDEIGNLPITAQQNLLRYLSAGQIQITGGDTKDVQTQIIAATNKDINDFQIFAQDLKDRFDEVIHLSPLRERKEDIPDLINYFLNRSPKATILKKEVIDFLLEHDWPDNVRGLEKWISSLMRKFKNGGEIALSDIPERYKKDMEVKEEDVDDYLPDLPLPVPLQPDYVELIREKARQIANGKSSEVDKLLKQNPGTEKQRQYNKRKN